LEDVPYKLSLLIITCLIFFYGSKDKPFDWLPIVEPIVEIACVLHIFFTFNMNAMYFIVIAPTSLIPYDFGDVGTKEGRVEESNEAEDLQKQSKPYETPVPEPPVVEYKEPMYILLMQHASGAMMPYYFIFTLVISIMGCFYSKFFHSLILLEFFRQPAGVLVMKACMVGAPNLARSGVMGITMILLWACIGWQYFQEAITEVNYCNTFYQCTLKALQDGFRGDLNTMHGDDHGNIRGDYIPPEVFTEKIDYQMQVIFILIFFMLWEFILAGIIQGQIIDAFAEIRLNDDEKGRDARENCMVCSMSRFALESTNINFYDHIKKEHNPMFYLFFFGYLIDKDQDNYTGLESYVRENLDRCSTAFVPINTCAAQNQAKTDDSNEVTNAMLEETLTGMNSSLQDITSALNLLQGRVDSLAQTDDVAP